MCCLFWYLRSKQSSRLIEIEDSQAHRRSSTRRWGPLPPFTLGTSLSTQLKSRFTSFSPGLERLKRLSWVSIRTPKPPVVSVSSCGFSFSFSPQCYRVSFISWWLCVCCYQVLLERGHWGCSQVYKWHHSWRPPYTCWLWLGLPRRKAMGSW